MYEQDTIFFRQKLVNELETICKYNDSIAYASRLKKARQNLHTAIDQQNGFNGMYRWI